MAVSNKPELRGMSGAQKAAVIMLALNEDHAAKLFGLMDEDEIRELSQAMSGLGTINSQAVETLFIDFADQMSATGALMGSYESTERFLTKVFGDDRVNTIMEEIRGPAGRTMWDKLSNVNETVLATYLKNEYPQTVAVVLSKVRPAHAARVLSNLPEEFSMEVVMRLLRMEVVQQDVLDDIEKTLRTEFMSNLARTNQRDAHELIAEIFNNLERGAEARFISSLEEHDKEAAEKVKALMFTFEDLHRLDPGGIQTLLRKVEKPKLTLALKGASESLRNLFFTNMSERAGKLLREDMEAMGPVRLRDVDESQMHVVTIAKELAAKGDIMILDDKGDDELVY
ncbi:MAG: flagellar motor switch protein FliG [Alphaproteobacteria bacterium]